MLQCVWNELKKVPAWAWALLVVVAAAIAVLVYVAGPVLVGMAGIGAGLLFLLGLGIPMWAAAALIGLGATLLATLLLAVQRCGNQTPPPRTEFPHPTRPERLPPPDGPGLR